MIRPLNGYRFGRSVALHIYMFAYVPEASDKMAELYWNKAESFMAGSVSDIKLGVFHLMACAGIVAHTYGVDLSIPLLEDDGSYRTY